ncbi:MAG: HEAT repeat domain-containing protein [Pirellulaceae bacterium]
MVKQITFLLAMCLCSGCADGPFYAIKRANPYFQAEFRRDRELGPTFEDRLGEMQKLESTITRMDPSKQALWADRLEQIIRDDSSSELRARAVAAVASIQTESALRALNAASADEVEKVRLAACQAWKKRGDTAARDMLLSLATKADETTSVRQAAIESLSAFDEAEVRSALALLLEDRSPAVQYQVAQSLKTMTGQDFGGDFEKWKQFMAGENPDPPTPKSMSAAIWESLPSWRR